MSSSKRARRRRRQAARKIRAKRARLAPPAAAVPLRHGRAHAPTAVSRPTAWSALAGVGAASMVMLLPAVHTFTRSGPPFYATMTAGAISPDRPDNPHNEPGEWLQYQLGPQLGTARADVMVGPADPWADEVARYRYGQWGPNLYGD
jgi:hypothetical protein